MCFTGPRGRLAGPERPELLPALVSWRCVTKHPQTAMQSHSHFILLLKAVGQSPQKDTEGTSLLCSAASGPGARTVPRQPPVRPLHVAQASPGRGGRRGAEHLPSVVTQDSRAAALQPCMVSLGGSGITAALLPTDSRGHQHPQTREERTEASPSHGRRSRTFAAIFSTATRLPILSLQFLPLRFENSAVGQANESCSVVFNSL